ncbi:MAG: hypothetical protein NW224_30125 [Leptolyngbyaceae cyanobacterium bins.302]|nr:hypothetical protein [Leptolyngbyaceae cyanobacterium bins.302]
MASSFHVSLPADEARTIEASAQAQGINPTQLIRNRLREWEDQKQLKARIQKVEVQLDAQQLLLECIALDTAPESLKGNRQALIDKINERLSQFDETSTRK